jgi:diguanylate cyclase (GGDEF)-like protein
MGVARQGSTVPDDQPLSERNLLKLMQAVVEVSACLDVQEVIRTTLNHLSKLLHVRKREVWSYFQLQEEMTRWQYILPGNSESLLTEADICWFAQQSLFATRLTEGNILELHKGDADLRAEERSFLDDRKISRLLALPVISKRQVWGVMGVACSQKIAPFSGEEITIGQILANQAAIALENAYLFQHATRSTRELEALYEASLQVNSSLELSKVLIAILKSIISIIRNTRHVHIYLCEADEIVFGAAMWSDGSTETPWKLPREHGITRKVVESGKIYHIPDYSLHPLYKDSPEEWGRSMVSIPLKIDKRVVGVMNIAFNIKGDVLPDTLRLIELLATQAASAIDKASLHAQVEQQARTDALTTLPNRRAFDERLSDEIRRSSRYKHVFSMLMMDLNGFKLINDTFGHPAGDSALQQVAVFLHEAVRDTDYVARFGGDEFALILPETDQISAQQVAKYIRLEMDEHEFTLPDGEKVSLSACLGVSSFPEHGISSGQLVAVADQKLYEQKRLRKQQR